MAPLAQASPIDTVKWKVLPWPSSLSTHKRPPINVTSCLQIASPKPAPASCLNVAREPDAERRATANGALDGDRPTEQVEHATHDMETQARAAVASVD